jgi:hypothetical protein
MDERFPEVTVAARRGAALLDHVCPEWEYRIQFPPWMQSASACILAQVYGTYDRGKAKLFGRATGVRSAYAAVIFYGFEIAEASFVHERYVALDEAWSSEIKNRKERAHV